jgi:monothiol glutaredoxin
VNNDEIREFIQQAIDENNVMLFMKGTPNQPACGFSARTAGALNALGVQYAALDILPDPRIREELSGLSGWPTIPQLFVNKESPEPEPQAEPARRPIGLENRLD